MIMLNYRDHGLNVSANSLSGPPPPNQALVDTLQEALTDAITRRIDATKTHLLRAVKPLILDSTSRTDDAMQDLQSSLSSQLNSHAAKLAAGAAHTEHLGQCMETGIQVRTYTHTHTSSSLTLTTPVLGLLSVELVPEHTECQWDVASIQGQC